MVALSGPGWKLAPCLVALIDEANKIAPNRSTAWDGSIGDAGHQARVSDHNPDDDPTDADRTRWVCAVDLTDDDLHHMNVRVLFDHLRIVKDRRVKYEIHEGKIVKGYAKDGHPAWTLLPYTGPNGHFHHLHVSCWNTAAARNDTSTWFDTAVHEEDEMSAEDIAAIKAELAALRADVKTVKADVKATRDQVIPRGMSNKTAAKKGNVRGMVKALGAPDDADP